MNRYLCASAQGLGMTIVLACSQGSLAVGSETTARLLPIKPTMACAAMRDLNLSGIADRVVHIQSAVEVTQGELHPYCKVEGTVEPAVRFEVHLPLNGWTQRYLQTGCGGLCGMLHVDLDDHARACVPAAHGELAMASTDMGHEGAMDGSWAARNPQARIDFGYRGVHVTAVVAKALIAHFYGQAPRFSYFSGCSDGGREALMEAQRYPQDFNGIAAGAPALNFSVQNSFYHAWNALSNTAPDGGTILAAEKLPILHAAAVAACDGLDGLKDGLIDDPRRCQFDPASVQCQAGRDGSECLSAAEVQAARRIYAGAHDAAGGKLVIGGPMPGSELSWAGVFVPQGQGPIFSALIATGSVRNLYYPDPLPESWKLKDLKFDRATLDSFKLRAIYDATNPDLSHFASSGGRLLMWHGWSDPHISPLNSIAYYTAMQQQMGSERVSQFARLFLFSGMYHCGGGDGLFVFDILTPLMAWVETGIAPERIDAAHDAAPSRMGPSQAKIDRTRPVFAYPKIARYTGSGSADNGANFVAAEPAGPGIPPVNWLGASYMVPGLQQTCEVVGAATHCKPTR
jgi:hypothetical protein